VVQQRDSPIELHARRLGTGDPEVDGTRRVIVAHLTPHRVGSGRDQQNREHSREGRAGRTSATYRTRRSTFF
jgi:hypothetical protein